jgi:hypothetical protein
MLILPISVQLITAYAISTKKGGMAGPSCMHHVKSNCKQSLLALKNLPTIIIELKDRCIWLQMTAL